MSGGSSLQAMPRRSILHGRRPREQLLRDRRRADGGPEAREAGSVRAGSHRSAVLHASPAAQVLCHVLGPSFLVLIRVP